MGRNYQIFWRHFISPPNPTPCLICYYCAWKGNRVGRESHDQDLICVTGCPVPSVLLVADPRATLHLFFTKEPVPPLPVHPGEQEVITSIQIYWVSVHCYVEEHELGIQRYIENWFQMKCSGERKRLTLGVWIVAGVVLELDLLIPRLELHVWQNLHPARCFWSAQSSLRGQTASIVQTQDMSTSKVDLENAKADR